LAQLNSLIVTGDSRFLNTINGNTTSSNAIHRATMDSSSTATAFVLTADGIDSLYDGLIITCKNTKVASASGCTINLNGLGAKSIWTSQDNGACTTHWGLNQTYLFVYDSTNSRWELQQGRNTNSTYNFSGTTFYSGNSGNATHDANAAVKNGNYYYSSNGPTTTLGATTSDGALYVQSYSDSWVGQIAQDYRDGDIFLRGRNNGTWSDWKKPDAGTVNGYTVAKSVPSNAVFTDTNNAVTQTATSTNANYEVLFSATADNTTRTEGARKYSNLTFNPSTGNLNTTKINGVTVGSSPKFTDNDTHRPIKVNGTQLLGNNSTAVNFKAGSNITLSGSGSDITINASGGASHIRYNQTDDTIEVEDSNGVWHLYEHVGLDYLYWYKDGNYYPDYTGGWECDRSGATINYAYNGNSLRLFHPPDIANNLTWKMQQYNVPSSGFIGCHITYALMSSYYYSTNFTFYLVNSSGGTISQKTINVPGGSYAEHRASGELTLTGIASGTDKIGIKIYIDGDNHCNREVVLTDCYLFK
jgi:hypothetical protein